LVVIRVAQNLEEVANAGLVAFLGAVDVVA